ncbi:hypothetical protein [Tenacibaculum sp. M341]|uniref:hypothetical protein n=1 Tax=Tenacibaculum sp. M341 TaxID=2530339 RepID=UPI00104AFA3A|nr:hypothetical protein [Tenacibaculum sp. M341]TCI93785.1 hypothetical protein EYW44_05050 [Tenacibaculum sp. M341]
MKKNILNQIKANILTKEEKKTIVGGYDGSFTGSCSFIICSGNNGALAYKPGCPTYSSGRRLYVYNPNPSLFCWE